MQIITVPLTSVLICLAGGSVKITNTDTDNNQRKAPMSLEAFLNSNPPLYVLEEIREGIAEMDPEEHQGADLQPLYDLEDAVLAAVEHDAAAEEEMVEEEARSYVDADYDMRYGHDEE